MTETDVIILGAGAAGLFAAGQAGQRSLRVALLEKADAPGKKILISGGGRCNFTNLGAGPANYLSANPHFAKSALACYTPADFIALSIATASRGTKRRWGNCSAMDRPNRSWRCCWRNARLTA